MSDVSVVDFMVDDVIEFSAHFEQCNSLFDANFEDDCEFTIYLHECYDRVVDKILYGSRAYWDAQPTLIAKQGFLYVYSDWDVNDQGRYIPGIKIGDGSSYLIDSPAISLDTSMLDDHIKNTTVHITSDERDFWNNKVRCYMNGGVNSEELIFTTN